MLSRTIAFITGILCLYQLPQLPPNGLYLLFGLLAAVSCFYPLAPKARALPLLFFLGFAWAGLDANQRLIPSLAPQFEGIPITVTGRVDSLPQHKGRVLHFIFRPEKAFLRDGKRILLPERLRLSWYDAAPHALVPGQRWRFQVKLKRPWAMRNPGGFDYEQWLFLKGIRATGYLLGKVKPQLLADESSGYRIMRLRYGLQRQLQQVLAGKPMRGIITALAIGDRSAISDAQWHVLLTTGTNHLVAISGLHVGLAAGLVFWLVGWLWRFCPVCCLMIPAHRVAALSAMLAAVVYAALAGFSIPTQRAMIMLALVLGAVWWGKSLQPQRVLMLALWAVLLHDPVSVLSAGFWLSFAAVAWILYGMRGRIRGTGFWWRWGRVQLLVALGLLPLLLFFFQQDSLSAPLANLLAVPWVSLLVVPLTLGGIVLLGVLPAAGSVVLQLAATLMEWFWPLLHWLAEALPALPLAVNGWTLLPAFLGLLWLLAPRGWPLRPAGTVLLLPLLLSHNPAPAFGTARFTLLDVGQGLSTVLQTRHHTLVFDTGPRYPGGFDTGDAVVVPFLREQGIRQVDTLIVSHRGNDHSGGARSLVHQIRVRRILSSIRPGEGWLSHTQCRRGQHWRWDGVAFRVLGPSAGQSDEDQNERSCVLRVTAGGESLLLTGDIERGGERALLASGERLTADILQAPHHGSATSSTAAFIHAVSPRVVLFAVGYRNRYGFPDPAVVRRYQGAGARTYRSDHSGALQFVLGEGKLTPRAWRQQHRKIWHM